MSQLTNELALLWQTKDSENIREILKGDLGQRVYSVLKMAEQADKELDITHQCITDLYDLDANVPRIKECLSDIQQMQSQ